MAHYLSEGDSIKYEMSYCKSKVDSNLKKWIIPVFLKHWSIKQPSENAFVFLSPNGDRDAVTWKMLYDNSVQYAKAFVKLGVKERDVVGITAPNCPKWLYVAFGAVFAGAIPMGIEIVLKDGSDMIALLNKLETCSTFVFDTEQNIITWNIFKTFLSSYSKSGNVTSDAIPSLRYVLTTSSDTVTSEILTIEELLRLPQDSVELPVINFEDVVALFQTSGSTGIPKVVAHKHMAFAHFGGAVLNDYFIGTCFYNEKPFSWISGTPFYAVTGSTRILPALFSMSPVEYAQFVIESVRREKCILLVAYPPLLLDMLDVFAKQGVNEDKAFVLIIVTGGQPIRKKLASHVIKFCSMFCNRYSATEAAPLLRKVSKVVDDFEDNNCGVPEEGIEAKMVSEDGEVVPVGTRGELYVKGPPMFSGYFNDPEMTRTFLSEDGWYKTDDIGYMNKDGEFIFEARKSELIISSTINVIPGDVESILLALSGVKDAVIVPIPDEALFQVICACVTLNTGSALTAEDLQKYCEDFHNEDTPVRVHLPTYYLIFEKFPELFTGKTNKRALIEEAIQRIESK